MAGLLDYASSVAGEAKKNVQGLLADPKQALMDILNNLTARAAASQAKTKAAWATRDPKIMAQNALDSSQTALGFAPLGITAWHGSPHKFDKFSMDKIGTGEGAQAYGHGLYFAENPKVAEGYQKALSTPEFSVANGTTFSQRDLIDKFGFNDRQASQITQALDQFNGDALKAAERIRANARSHIYGSTQHTRMNQAADFLAGMNNPQLTKVENPGALYKVDIPDEIIPRMLDWDKPLSEQPHVMDLINKKEAQRTKSVLDQRLQTLVNVGEDAPNAATLKRQIELLREEVANPQSGLGSMTGGEYYDYLRRRDMPPPEQADMFRGAGIPGIRYLDGGSRGAGTGTSNFVVFDPDMIRILERNGISTGQQPWKPGEWK